MEKDTFIQEHWNKNAPSRFRELTGKTDDTYFGVTIPSVLFLVSGSKRILDVGCGVGVLTNALTSPDREIVGVDFSGESIEIASENFPNVKFVCSNILDVDLPEKCDAITAIMFFHNVPKPQTIFTKMLSMLAEKGKLIMVVPNSVVWFEKRRAIAERCIDFQDEDAYFIPFKIRNHAEHPSKFVYFNRSREEYIQLLSTAGFKNIEQITAIPGVSVPSDFLILLAEKSD